MSEPHERLQQAREARGYKTGTAAAEAFGWPVSTYLGHENGSRGLRADAARRYAAALDADPAWLLLGDTATDPNRSAPHPDKNSWGKDMDAAALALPCVDINEGRVTLNIQANVSMGVAAQILTLIEGDKP